MNGKVPPLAFNVVPVRGLFMDTIPLWKSLVEGALSFVHIDCDLYSSTRSVLMGLNDRIVPGTILAFDELFPNTDMDEYPLWEHGEWRALLEWMAEHGRKVRPLARGCTMSVAFVVV